MREIFRISVAALPRCAHLGEYPFARDPTSFAAARSPIRGRAFA
jgi:hypothetical protein